MVIYPIHALKIGDLRLRFFASPGTAQDMPWHSASDLWRTLGCTEKWTGRIVDKLCSLHFPNLVQKLETETGLEVIAPHFIALQPYDALIARGMAFESQKEIYTTAAHEAAFMQASKQNSDPLIAAVAEMVCGGLEAEAFYTTIARSNHYGNCGQKSRF